jgi:hypothetical protein
MKFRSAVGAGVVALAAAAALVAGTTGTASAAPVKGTATTTHDVGAVTDSLGEETTCGVKSPWTSCKTATIHSNSEHRLSWFACAASGHYADWQIKDADNGVIVAQGHLEAGWCLGNRIGGLYGRYWAWIFNTRGGAWIAIDSNQ